MSDLQSTITDARKELRDWAEDNQDCTEPHDTIFEIADSNVPIHYSDLLEWASMNTGLATNVPDCGPAFDGTPTPTNIIAANIYELLASEMFEEWREIQAEWEEADESLDCQVCGDTVDQDSDDYEYLSHGMICGECYRESGN